MSVTGEHAAVPEPKPQSLQDRALSIPDRIFKKEAMGVLVLIIAGAVGGIGGASWGQGKFDAGVQAGALVVVKPVKDDLEAHKRDEAEKLATLERKLAEVVTKQDAAEVVNARRFEVMINTVLERRLQPGTAELAQPQTDGGR